MKINTGILAYVRKNHYLCTPMRADGKSKRNKADHSKKEQAELE